MKSRIKVSLVQQKCNATREENFKISKNKIIEAAQEGADLVVLPELHLNPYFCQSEDVKNFDLAESIPGPTTDRLSQLAKELGIVIVSTLFEKRAAGIYHNTAVVFEKDGTLAGKYRKMHIPDDPGYYEKFYFTPGDLGFTPIDTSVGRLGLLICWDQWFPEAARLMALAGADLLIYPTAIGWAPEDDREEQLRQLDAWVTVQRGHSIANCLPIISCNRVGVERGKDKSEIYFWGNSFILGPQGEFLSRASDQDEGIFSAEINKTQVDQVRRIWPYFRDRRIDSYQGILKRYLSDSKE